MQQIKIYFLLFACLIAASCSTTRRLKPGQVLYTGADVKINPDSAGRIDREKDIKNTLETKTRPRPNKSFLGIKWKLQLYNLAPDTVKPRGLGNWLKNKVGEAPVLLSEVKLGYNNNVLKSYLISQGYLQAEVTGDTLVKNKKGKAIYTAYTGLRYKINSISFPKDTGTLTRNINVNKDKSLIKVGEFYDLETYKSERIRIDNDLKENGYFYFSPDYLLVQVDSTIGKNLVDTWVKVKDITPIAALKPYTIKNINIYPSYNLRRDSLLRGLEPLVYKDFNIYDNRKTFKPKVFERLVFFKKGEKYNRRDHNQSLNRMVNIGAFQDVRAEFLPLDSFRNNELDLNIYLTPLKKNSLSFSVTGTNKSNNFVGSEVKITQTTRNLFRGAEILDVSASGGFETQYSGQSKGINSYSFTAEGKLTFPQFIVPFYKPESTTAFIPKTVASLSYQLLSRDTVYKLNSFKAEYGYNWKENLYKEHNLNPISINLVRPTQRDPADLQELYDKTPGLENTLQEQFIIGSNYNFTFTNQMEDSRRNNTYFYGSLETGGNVWGLFTSKDENGKRAIFDIPLTQFVRLETDLRNYHKINRNLIWANRLNLGYGHAYGNSTSLPFVRQFFAGGSNDVRAFRARSLGPGSYKVPEEQTFADQAGDIKALLNTELRFKISGIIHGAVFADAGNIWLRKEDPDRPGSAFKFKNAFSELAVGTGAGIRIDATIFVIRLDGAFPIRKPYLPSGERWVLNQVDFGSKTWRRENFILNIGIGYPF
ncbi:translocation and assembly module lipoprotein TamL [Pedobacter insulae]|uniref:Outer membrane protein assembly factor BamA n=1 Tax=Pedobacter insulae TaxID=414048 RepID=A0A1I2Y6F7_9SPHI|nr:BamA/TamA family outer membrane protein [Pedobacter insulae]SFH21253.1 Outer membrane protein assembly factor BamA [Pedobacter insulae]